MQKFTYVICSLMLLIVVGLSAAIAQTGSSNITGSVRDVNGAVVPGATVTAKNEQIKQAGFCIGGSSSKRVWI